MEHYSGFDATSDDIRSTYLCRVFEFAKEKYISLGGNRPFTIAVQQIATELTGGYELMTKERAAIHAGVLAGGAALRVADAQKEIVIPKQTTSAAEIQQVLN